MSVLLTNVEEEDGVQLRSKLSLALPSERVTVNTRTKVCDQRSRRPRRLLAALVGLVAVIATLTVPTAAQAATPTVKVVDVKTTVKDTPTNTQVSTAVTVQATKPTSTKPGTVSPMAGTVVVYTCTMLENYPHNSGHNPGQINVVGTATCQVPMTSVYLVQNLLFNGRKWAYNYNYATPGGTYQMAQANATCQVGSWQGVMQWWLTWPAGFEPPAASGVVQSPVLPITC